MNTHLPKSGKSSLLDGANGWKILVDYDRCKIVFPPEIYATPERPDIILWSGSLRRILLIELTVPVEGGIEAASIRKVGRYASLCSNIQNSSWKPVLLNIEVGARGYVANSTRRCFRKLGMTGREVTALCRTLATVAARCSYAIYLSHDSPVWDRDRALVTLDCSDQSISDALTRCLATGSSGTHRVDQS